MLLLALVLPLALAAEPLAAEPLAAEPLAAEPLAAEPPAWVASEARYAVHVGGAGQVDLEATYTFRPVLPGWFDGVLVGPGLIVQSVSGPVVPTLDGLALTLSPGTGPVTVTVRGALTASAQGELNLPVLPAAIQRVKIDAPGFDVEDNAVDGYLRGADHLSLTLTPHQERAPVVATSLVIAEVGTAFWEDEGSLELRSEVHLRARRGSVQVATLSVAGLDEVEVKSANLKRWSRAGDTLTVEARAPVKGSWILAISGKAKPGGAVPWPQPQGVQRTEAWWVLGRSSDTELVPVRAPATVPAREAPSWTRGLSETAPLAFFHGSTPPELRVDRFEPLMGPETVIEQADFRVGLNEDGRVLLRATYLVRNERKQYLHCMPPPGFVPVAARVGSRPIAVLSDGQGGLYVSLERSLETVQGLVSFPLELTWLGTGEAWKENTRKGSVVLALPAVDAPIQHADWTVHLPRGYRSLDAKTGVEGGVEGGVVGGVLAGEVAEASSGKREEVQTTLDQAIQAYRSNDFETAQVWIDHAKAIDANDANVNRLQSNLDVLIGDDKSKDEDEVMSRRVKDLANAKTDEMRNRQDATYKEAKKALASGDTTVAREKLAEVFSSSGSLARIEQKENLEQADLHAQAGEMLKNLGYVGASEVGKADDDYGYVVDGMEVSNESPPEEVDKDGIGDEIDVEEPHPPAVEPAPEQPVLTEDTAQTISVEMLERIPTGRSYQSAVQSVPGVSAERKLRIKYKSTTEASYDDTPASATTPVITARPSPPPAAPKPSNGPKSGAKTPPRATTRMTDARAALSVHPTVLTLAMPEGGALFTRSDALLDPGEQPTLTLRYRSGDPR